VTGIAYLDCIGGIAGDMLLAALIDAGASRERLDDVVTMLELPRVDIEITRVERHGIRALHIDVHAHDDQHDRPYAEIRELISRAPLPERVSERSLETFRRLAESEGAIHGVPPEAVRFHEVGGVDALVDVCGAMTLLDDLGIEHVGCSPLPYSRGLVDAAHGTLPVPAPATLALLAGARFVGVETEAELVTPTGAAIAATIVDSWGMLPPLVLERVGYGAGRRELADRPNLLRVVLGAKDEAGTQSRVSLLEANIDDLNPELVPDAVERCVAAGALDVWTMPAQMKKGRPGIVLSALTRPGDEAAVVRAMLEETSTLGVRLSRLHRYELEREERIVEVEGGSVRVKVGWLDGRVVNIAPEHDDCAALARASGRSVKSVWAAALAGAQEP
jgi:pyridinium-3,5-bisthiocarboxylic acid mononucleotide nickel chelatase